MAAVENITKKTPAEVDNILVDALGDKNRALNDISNSTKGIESYTKQIAETKKVLETSKRNPNSSSGPEYWEGIVARYQGRLDGFEEVLAKARVIAKASQELIDECNAEFARRGGWTRFWIVVNSNGHIHTSMSCTTCFPTTNYAWLPDLSGSTNAEVVELAGEGACTICFPDAPVDTRNRPSKIEEPAKKAAREERERKAAEKEANRQQKAITNPDGSVLRLAGRFGDVLKTESTAQQTVVRELVSVRLDEKGIYRMPNRDYLEEIKKNVELILVALAHKRGTTVEEQRELMTKKADAKIKKEWKR